MEPLVVAMKPHPRGMWKHPEVGAGLHGPCSHLHQILPVPPGKSEWGEGRADRGLWTSQAWEVHKGWSKAI